MPNLLAFLFGNDVFQPSCRCCRCDVILPPIHAADHLCEACWSIEAEKVRAQIRAEFEEVLHGQKVWDQDRFSK